MSALVLLLALSLQTAFVEFSFCREDVRPGEPAECVRLDDQGVGAFVVRSDSGETAEPLELGQSATNRFLELLRKTSYLEKAAEYETASAANVGRKVMALEGEWGRREAAYSYSSRSEVIALQSFLERLIDQQALAAQLGFALQFDRLNLPTLLESAEEGLKRDRIPDPSGLLGVLREIVADSQAVGIARQAAERLIGDIEKD